MLNQPNAETHRRSSLQSSADPDSSGDFAPQHYLHYPKLREADVFWEKRVWQELNICSEENAHLQSNTPDLGQYLAEAVCAGQLRAFSPGQGTSLFGELWLGCGAQPGSEPMESERPMTQPAAPRGRRTLVNPSTLVNPGTLVNPSTLVNPTTLVIVEDWIVDESSFEQRPRMIALGLLAADPVPSGSGAGVSKTTGMPDVLAWIPFDEARPLLVGTQALPPTKEQPGLSWDGVLLLRRFDSRLLKVSNVLDLPWSADDGNPDGLWKP
ncbi:MAG: hypothetical protein GC205_02940 [Bacteroidetes bacterium]|nr:hypothetical protein [Bacteroidota bacterium]